MAVNVGIIGAGSRVRYLTRLLLDAAGGTNAIHIAGLYDPWDASVSRAREELGESLIRYPSVEALLSDDSISWIMIGSWNRYHREQIVAALEAGKHVFTEKPLAVSLDDCVAIKEAASRSRGLLTIGFTLRFSPHYRKIKEIIEGGSIGGIVSLEFNEVLDFNHGGFIHADWRRNRADAGTHLLEKCCHDIDLVNWVCESRTMRAASFGGLNFFRPENSYRVKEVGPNEQGRPAYMTWERTTGLNPFTADKDIVDNQVAIMEFANEIRCTFHTNCNSAIPQRRMYILGTHGTIEADVVTGQIHARPISFSAPIADYSTGVKGNHGSGDPALTRHLAQMMLENAENLATLDDGIASAVTCFGIDDAMDSGRVVAMAPYWARIDAVARARV